MSTPTQAGEYRRRTVPLVVALLLPLAVGMVSGWITADGVRSWYPSIAKPGFTPPDWVFGPVWTALYISMGWASYLIWRRGFHAPGVRAALTFYAIQLLLNSLWSPLFFGLQSPGLAFAEIVVFWAALAWTVVLFRRVSLAAALVMMPYLAWVSFATVLNFAIWRLNT